MFIIRLIAARLAAIPPERFVTFITPIVTPIIGVVSGWLAAKFPGLHLTDTQILAFALAGAASAWGALQHWLKGSREYQADVRKARLASAPSDADPEEVLSHGDHTHPDDLIPDVDDLDRERSKAEEEQEVA